MRQRANQQSAILEPVSELVFQLGDTRRINQ
jgi:hypothetical protein